MQNDNLAIIFGRRSVRVYTPGEIEETKVTRMLEAAMAAPSAMGKDPWRFIVVRQRAALTRMAEFLPGGSMLRSAPMAILVCGDLDSTLDRQLSYLLQDCSACIENLLLAAHGLGVGACWVGIHPGEDSIRQTRETFRLPTSFVPVAAIALGYPGEQLETRTRYDAGKIRLERW